MLSKIIKNKKFSKNFQKVLKWKKAYYNSIFGHTLHKYKLASIPLAVRVSAFYLQNEKGFTSLEIYYILTSVLEKLNRGYMVK